ncbi:hypothetical protein Hanom_Chr04g00357261 [Helianthus anomalus]
MFWFCCQFAPCQEQNGKTNNLDGVRGGEQTGKKTKKSGSKMAILKGLEQNRESDQTTGSKTKVYSNINYKKMNGVFFLSFSLFRNLV